MVQWRFPFILMISITLFAINISNPRPPYIVTRTSNFISDHLKRMGKIQNREDFALSKAFILGDKRSLTKDLKEKFSALHINHLFTPSGIHFSSFFLIFLPLIKRLRKSGRRRLAFFIELFICLLPFGLNQFYSLKRISILRITNMAFRKLKIRLDFFYIFLLSFFFDFIFGTYAQSPMSFTFSFIFLGSLLANTKFSSIALSFFCANLILTLFFYTKVSFIGFFLGFLLTSVFSLIFPFLFISYWLSSLIQLNFSFPFLYIINTISDCFYSLTIYSPEFEIDFIGLLFILFYSKTRKLRFLIIALIISSTRIYNVPENRVNLKDSDTTYIIKNWKIDGKVERGSNLDQKCTRKLLLGGHQIRCRNRKRR